jgi:hypothetical protein
MVVVAKADAELGEGPIWDTRHSRLLFLDILQSKIFSYSVRPGDRLHRPRTGGGSFLPWVSPPQRCPGSRGPPGCAAPRVSSARRGPGCGYHIDQARGLARGGNTLYSKFPVPEIGYRLERSGTPFRTEPFRCLEDKLSRYRITHQSGWTPSRSHTHSRISSTGITPGKIKARVGMNQLPS